MRTAAAAIVALGTVTLAAQAPLPLRGQRGAGPAAPAQILPASATRGPDPDGP